VRLAKEPAIVAEFAAPVARFGRPILSWLLHSVLDIAIFVAI
jgi:hypothetical protein